MALAADGKPGTFLALADVKRVLFLAVPAMLALLTQTAINLVDTYFMGFLPEPERSDGQAMLSFALTLLWAIGGFLSAISVGTQALVGRREGQSHPHESGGVLANAVVLAVVSSTVVSIVAFLCIPSIFRLVSTHEDYIRVGTAYTQWRFVGCVSMVVTAAYKSFYDGTGRTYVHFWAALFMNVVNVLLCYALIFGELGAPRMGVAGAGLAAAVSSWVGLGAMILFSMRAVDRDKYRPYRSGVLSLSMMKNLARLSVPSGVATTVVMTGFILFIRIVHVFDNQAEANGGTESIYGAATTIIINVLSLTFFSCMAFGVSTATLVSQSLGARDPDSAERYAWSSVKIAVMAFGVLGLHEVLYPEFWIGIFNKSPEVIAAGASSMRLMGAAGPLIAAAMILTQALFGAGNPRFVMIVELCLHFGVLLPAAYCGGIVLHGGLLGVWSAAALYAALLAGIMAWKFRSGSWKTIDI
ncbi:MAG TPA: MATE family efflux transporter [Polyangiales bacterium]